MILTYRFRIKDKHAARLNAQARAVNFVWNFLNETQRKAVISGRRWLNGNDFWRLCAGATKEGLDMNAGTLSQVCRRYDQSRRQQRLPWLRWRGFKSLGWVPVRDKDLIFRDGAFWYRRERYDAWVTRPIADGARFGCSTFSRDARGRWYVNVSVTVDAPASAPTKAIGIDLGLKSLAVCSDGQTVHAARLYRKSESRLSQAQRGRRRRLVRSIHAKIAAQRRDHLHKASNQIARCGALIVVGDVSPSKLAKTNLAKSVLDAGWSDFRQMLSYKAIRHGGRYLEVSEAYTTRTCAECGSIAGPEGRAGLRIREWTCGDCGTVHDRDVNAARNILRLGLEALAGGAATERRGQNTGGMFSPQDHSDLSTDTGERTT